MSLKLSLAKRRRVSELSEKDNDGKSVDLTRCYAVDDGAAVEEKGIVHEY